MNVNLYNQGGEVIGEVNLPERIFDLKLNPDLVHQVLTSQLANARQVIAHTKGRGEVRGGGRKPWRQKGTGRARHASIRSPIWRGGGVTFGPTKERNFKKKINKTMKRRALFMVLSSKVRDGEFLMLDDLRFENMKTKASDCFFKNISDNLAGYRRGGKKNDSILLVTPSANRGIVRAVGNLPFAGVRPADSLNIGEVLGNKYLIMLKDAVAVIEKTYKI